MKKLFYALALIVCVMQWTQAQQANKFRVGLDFGYAIPDGGGGILVGVEPKYNIADNMNVGLRYESAVLAKKVPFEENLLGISSLDSELTASSSITGTFDYHFSTGTSSFAPFLGAGIGYNVLGNIEVDFSQVDGFDGEEDEETAKVGVDGKLGGLIRAGFELGKLRLAATYNLIGKSEIEGTEIKNSYLGISLGFYVGGGKWKN